MTPAIWGHLAMLLFSALVAGSFSLGSLAANDIAPAVVTVLRFWIASGILGLIVWKSGHMQSQSFRAPWRFFVLGGLFALYLTLMFEGLKTAAPVSLSAVFTLGPVMSAGFGYILLRQLVSPKIALGLAIGAAGALWVIFDADWASFRAFDIGRGEVIFFIGCVSHAIYTPMVRKLNRGEAVITSAFGTALAGAVLLTFMTLPSIVATPWPELPAIVWITILYTSVLATATTVLLIQFASLRLPSSKVMAYTYLVPSWVVLWEIALGGALPASLIYIGIAATVIALLILLFEGRSQTVR